MATVQVTICTVGNKALSGSTMPVPKSMAEASDTITSTAASQLSTITANLRGNNGVPSRFWCVVSTGNIFVDFGKNPVAAADRGWLVPAGVPMFFSVGTDGEKIAVKDVA